MVPPTVCIEVVLPKRLIARGTLDVDDYYSHLTLL